MVALPDIFDSGRATWDFTAVSNQENGVVAFFSQSMERKDSEEVHPTTPFSMPYNRTWFEHSGAYILFSDRTVSVATSALSQPFSIVAGELVAVRVARHKYDFGPQSFRLELKFGDGLFYPIPLTPGGPASVGVGIGIGGANTTATWTLSVGA